MATPDVSILVPVAPRAPWLGDCLDSIVAQTFQGWELVVVLDGDCDENRSSIESKDLGDRATLLVLQERSGVARALNRGLIRARGPFVARIDADDMCEPERIQRQWNELRSRPGLWVLGSAAWLMDETGSVTGIRHVKAGETRVARALGWRNSVIHPSVMMRRREVLSLGGYNEKPPRGQDYELWLRIAGRAGIDNMPDPLIRYRVHQHQHSRGPRLKSAAALRAARNSGANSSRDRVRAEVQHAAWVGGQLAGRALPSHVRAALSPHRNTFVRL